MPDLRTWGPATTLIVVIVSIVLVIGGAVVIVHPETLTFRQYLDDLKGFALAVAGLGLARGVHLGLAGEAAAADNDALPDLPAADPDAIPPDQGDASRG